MYPLLFAHQLHTCHNVPASIHSPTLPAFFEEVSTKKYMHFRKNHSVCKNALEKEREKGYTHTGQGNMVMAFFLLFQSVTIKSCHIPMTFFGGEGAYHFLILIKTTTPSNFLGFFYYIHIFFTKNRRCKKTTRGKSLSLTHIHARSIVAVWSVQPHISQGSVPHTDVGAAVIRRLLLHVIVVVGGRR